MEDIFHYYVEEIAQNIIQPMEYELTQRALTKEQEQEVIKEVMFWLLMFVWGKD